MLKTLCISLIYNDLAAKNTLNSNHRMHKLVRKFRQKSWCLQEIFNKLRCLSKKVSLPQPVSSTY